MNEHIGKAYIVAVDMGYGHQRAAYPLKDISATPSDWNIKGPYIISANNYPGIPKKDLKLWQSGRGIYEWISRMRELPFLGEKLFAAMNYFQRIDHFYPKRDQSKSMFQLDYIYKLINKKGLGKHLIKELNKNPLPLITTFFTPAFSAEEHGYKGKIYCLCTDTDISRAWAPVNPKNSRIIYFAPSHRVSERLKAYGVPADKIITTGFPLPKELVPRSGTEFTRSITHRRIMRLDPTGRFRKKFQALITDSIGNQTHGSSHGPVSIAFAIGGANAQFQIGLDVIESLAPDIKNGKYQLNLIAGVSNKIYTIFEKALKQHGLDMYRGKGVEIIYNADKMKYFEEFDKLLIDTDILWTKPSELSFYAGLGLPILIAPTLGSQEEFNQDWLQFTCAGIKQSNPKYTKEWLADWLDSGILAGMALNGYLDISKKGAYHIESVVLYDKHIEMSENHLI